MKNIFNMDNPFMQAMARVGDLMILSLITLVLCIPVVTFGPAVTALFKTVYALTKDTCGGTIVTYFRAFKENFRQSAIVGIVMLACLASFVCDVILLRLFYEGTAYQVLLALVVLLTALLLGVTAYVFPLITRYDNTLREHLRNAAILMIMNFPKTLLMLLAHLSPVLMFYFRAEFMLQTLVVWIFLAPGLIAQADAFILIPVFDRLEKEAAGNSENPEPSGEPGGDAYEEDTEED